MADILPNGRQQYFNSDGTPLSGGRLYTYAVGTTLKKMTWQDRAETIENENPIILNARGEAVVYFHGSYKLELRDANDNLLWVTQEIGFHEIDSARDAMFIAANAYASVPAGLAGTAVGDQFQVVSSDQLKINRYRHDVGPVAVIVASYPTSTAVENMNTARIVRDLEIEGQVASVAASFNPRGNWTTSTVYSAGTIGSLIDRRDIVFGPVGTAYAAIAYVVMVDHTSAANIADFATEVAAGKLFNTDAAQLAMDLLSTGTGKGTRMVSTAPTGGIARTLHDRLYSGYVLGSDFAPMDATIDDATGTVTGTDNTVAIRLALATGHLVLIDGPCKVSELSLTSGQSIATVGAGYITGPLNKSAIKIGNKVSSSVVGVSVDVVTRHPKMFYDNAARIAKGYATGALIADNLLTAGVSIENLKRSTIRVRHHDGYVGFKSDHAFNGSATPYAPSAGNENDSLRINVEGFGEVFTAANVLCKNILPGSDFGAVGSIDADGIKSLIGFGKGCSGTVGEVSAYGGFNGVVFEHEITNLNVSSVTVTDARSKSLVISKGDQSAGPVMTIGSVHLRAVAVAAGVGLENFSANVTIGNIVANGGFTAAHVRNSGDSGSTLTANSATLTGSGSGVGINTLNGALTRISQVETAGFTNCVFHNPGIFQADSVRVKTCTTGIATGGASKTSIGRLTSEGGVTGDIYNGGSNGVVHIGQVKGAAAGAFRLSTGATGSSLPDLDLTDVVGGFVSSTFFSGIKLGVMRLPGENERHYFAPGIFRTYGNGSPEGAVAAPKGSEYVQLDSSNQSVHRWYKVTGTGNTGWVAAGLP